MFTAAPIPWKDFALLQQKLHEVTISEQRERKNPPPLFSSGIVEGVYSERIVCEDRLLPALTNSKILFECHPMRRKFELTVESNKSQIMRDQIWFVHNEKTVTYDLRLRCVTVKLLHHHELALYGKDYTYEKHGVRYICVDGRSETIFVEPKVKTDYYNSEEEVMARLLSDIAGWRKYEDY